MQQVITTLVAIALVAIVIRQCRKPFGWIGRFFLWQMNFTHSALADWGLAHVAVGKSFTILDVGCGGGRTVQKLAKAASEGRVFGVDYSRKSVATARRMNASAIAVGHVEIREGSVSHLPYADATFDLVTAIETHYYWPDLTASLGEILRVLKPGGRLVLIAEAYKDSRFGLLHVMAMKPLGGRVLSRDEHRDFLSKAGYSDIDVREEYKRGWVCAVGRGRPASPGKDPGSVLEAAESREDAGR
jgi:ubiquinone/menaquinone biosynthesis C-methylase UbiE